MYSVNMDDLHDPLKNHEQYVDGQEVAMDPGQEFYFRCTAKGSYPKPEIRVYHAMRDITEEVRINIELGVGYGLAQFGRASDSQIL